MNLHLKIASANKPEQLTTGMKTERKHSTKEFKFSATAPVRNLNTTLSTLPKAANSAKATNKLNPIPAHERHRNRQKPRKLF